jgi:hypothetical protein
MDPSSLIFLLLSKPDRSFWEILFLTCFVIVFLSLIKSYYVQDFFSDLFENLFKKKVKSEYTIIYNEYRCPSFESYPGSRANPSEYPPHELLAIIRMVDKLKPDIKGGININKGTQDLDAYKIDYTIKEPHGVKLTKDIYIKTEIRDSNLKNSEKFGADRTDKNYKHIEHRIILYSYVLNQHELMKVLTCWVDEYKRDIDMPDDGLYYCEYNSNKKPSQDDDSFMVMRGDLYGNMNKNWIITPFKTNKTFDKLFFPEKDLLLKRLENFVNGKVFYEKAGIPYMFGLLLSGIPGAGKSSTIKAIAGELDMHILNIALSKIKTSSELVDIFTNLYVNNKKIPIEKRIIIFEDIDCMSNIVLDRKTKTSCADETNDDLDENMDRSDKSEENEHKTPSMDKRMIIINNDISKDGDKLGKKYDNDKLTLQTLLNILDGLMEQPGRVVIMTTNHPEKLDPALIRWGRMDMKIDFRHATTESISDMFSFYYSCAELYRGASGSGIRKFSKSKNSTKSTKIILMDDKKEKRESFDDLLEKIKTTEIFKGKFSAAEIISDILLMIDDPFECYELLIKKANIREKSSDGKIEFTNSIDSMD